MHYTSKVDKKSKVLTERHKPALIDEVCRQNMRVDLLPRLLSNKNEHSCKLQHLKLHWTCYSQLKVSLP